MTKRFNVFAKLFISAVFLFSILEPVRVSAASIEQSIAEKRLNLAISDFTAFEQCQVKDTIVNRDEILGLVSVMVPENELEERQAYYLTCSGVKDAYPDSFAYKAVVPADPNYAAYQYNLKGIGMETAWNTTKGSSSVIVAVIDTGVDPTGTLSDFGTGIVLKGARILSNDYGYQTVSMDTTVGQYSYDGGSHGTAVAMTIAAAMNTKGITGIAPNVKILPIKVFRDEKTLNENVGAYNQDVAKGIVVAVDMGADIINLSLGSYYYDSALAAAVQYAVRRNVLVIAASGNGSDYNGTDCTYCSPYAEDINYPAMFEEVLSVGSVDKNKNLSNFSNYTGGVLDLVAYGEDIWLPWRKEAKFKLLDGTSFSSPTVAGVAALVMSAYPALSALQVRAALLKGATDIATYGTGYDYQTGYGMVNAPNALTAASQINAKDDHDDTLAKAVIADWQTPIQGDLSFIGDRDLYCFTTYKIEYLKIDLTFENALAPYMDFYRLDENNALVNMLSNPFRINEIINLPKGSYCVSVADRDGLANATNGKYSITFDSYTLAATPKIYTNSRYGVMNPEEVSFDPVSLVVEASYQHTITVTKDGEPYTLPELMVFNDYGDYVVTVEDVKGHVSTSSFKVRTGINLTGFRNGFLYNTDITVRFTADSATINGEPLTSGTVVSVDGTYELVFNLGDKVYTASFTIDKTPPVISGVKPVSFFQTDPITFNEGTAKLDGYPFVSGTVVSTIGGHNLSVTDLAGNKSYVYFNVISGISFSGLYSESTIDSINLRWNYAYFANYYKVYEVDPATGDKTLLDQVTVLNYKVTGLTELNESHQYEVVACATVGADTLCSLPQSITAKTMLPAVEPTLTRLTYKSFRITWNAVTKATGYDILLNSAVIASTSDTTIDVVLPEPTYRYPTWNINVVATAVINDEKVSGVVGYTKSPGLDTLTPTGFTMTVQEDGSALMTWNKVEGASHYIVNFNDTNYNININQTTTDLSFSVSDVPFGVYIYGSVRAVSTLENGMKIESSYASTSILMPPVAPTVTGTATSADSFTLNWTRGTYDSGSTIYQLNPVTQEYEVLIDSTPSKTMSFTGKNVGVVYTYKVRSYQLKNNERVYGAYSEAFSISTVPLATTGLITTFIGADKIQISWSHQSGITDYEIYTATSLTGTYTLKTTVTDGTDSAMITGLPFNTTIYFKIKPIVVLGSTRIEGPLSATGVGYKTSLEYPVLTALSKSYTSIQLSWKPVPTASGYEVYGVLGDKVPTTLLATTTGTTYTQSSLSPGVYYSYRIRSYRMVGTLKVYGPYSLVSLVSPVPATPVITVVSNGYNALKVSWSAIAGAADYEVYYKKEGTPDYVGLQVGNVTSYVITGLEPDVNYVVIVYAVRLQNNGRLYSEESAPVTAKALPSTPKVTGTVIDYQTVKFTWVAIAGATGYLIEKYNSDTAAYELVLDTTELSYTETGLTSGTLNTYRVTAYVPYNDTKINSLSSTPVTLTPIPALTTGFKVSLPKYTELSLSWNAVDGATGYEITRSTTATGTYALVANVEDALTYVNTGLAFNTTYYYKVRAYRTVGDIKVYGTATAYVSGKTALETVLNPAAAYTAYNSNKITWSAVNGATGYEIYRSIGTSTTYALIATLAATTYTNTALYTNTKYNYKIRAYRLVGTVKVYGAFSSIVSATPLPWAPTVTVASVNNTTLKVSWPAVAGANGYEVSYATSENGTYTKLALLTTTSVSISKLLTNTTYFVKVRAYRIVNYVKIYGASSIIVSGTPIPATPVVTAVSGGVGSAKVSWLAITGASGYEVYLKTPESSDYFLAQDTTALTVTLTRLQTGTVQSVKVLAYQMVNGEKVYSLESAVKTVTPIPSTVTGFKLAMPSITSLKLTWTSVDGATGYEIFKSTTATGTFVSIGTVGQVNEFTVTGLTFNTTTYYKIRALYTDDNGTVAGLSTTALTAKTVPSTVQLKVVNTSYNANALSWDAIEGASGYEIYVSTGTSTYYTLLKTQTITAFNHTALVFNAQYNYKVRAYKLVGTTKIFGAFSTLTSVKTAVTAPTAIVSLTHDSIGLTWNAVTGASGYEVSIATSLTGPYTVTTQTAVSKTYSGLTTGTTYYVKIRSYRLISTTKVYGQYAPVITVTPSLSVPALSLDGLTSTTVTFTWAAVAGATDYEVRIKSDALDAEWVVESVSELTVTFSDLDPSAHYVAEIRAVKKVGEVPYYSEYSSDLAFSYADTY